MVASELYRLVRGVGFPPDTAEAMVAIALKESGGNPAAFNNKPPDRSYGLFQINMLGALGPDRIRWFGLQKEEDLFDPVVNAQAAYKLWAGSDANLDRHWYIYRDPFNARRFQQYLPEAKQARAEVEGAADFSVTGYGISDRDETLYDFTMPVLANPLDSLDMLTGSRHTTYLALTAALLIVILLTRRDSRYT